MNRWQLFLWTPLTPGMCRTVQTYRSAATRSRNDRIPKRCTATPPAWRRVSYSCRVRTYVMRKLRFGPRLCSRVKVKVFPDTVYGPRRVSLLLGATTPSGPVTNPPSNKIPPSSHNMSSEDEERARTNHFGPFACEDCQRPSSNRVSNVPSCAASSGTVQPGVIVIVWMTHVPTRLGS